MDERDAAVVAKADVQRRAIQYLGWRLGLPAPTSKMRGNALFWLNKYKFYSQDLINNLFMHPYTKIEFLQRDLSVSRLTATRYLDALAEGGVLQKRKIGRSNYYINRPLYRILAGEAMTEGEA